VSWLSEPGNGAGAGGYYVPDWVGSDAGPMRMSYFFMSAWKLAPAFLFLQRSW